MVKSDNNLPVFQVKENYKGEFLENPNRLVKENFDVKLFTICKKQQFNSYEIIFKSRKGGLKAN